MLFPECRLPLMTANHKRSVERFLLVVIILLVNLVLGVRQDSFYQIAFGAILAITLFSGTWNVLHLSLFLFLMSLNSVLFPDLTSNVPSAKFLLPLSTSTAILVLFFRGRLSLAWAGKGAIDRVSLILICATGVVSAAALILWALRTENLGAGVHMVQGFSKYPKWLLFGFGVPLFALANAFAEEAIFRGIMQSALDRAFGRKSVVLILQASSFAAFHFVSGFPNGYTGYLMALIYGIMLGYLKKRSGGLLAPYSTHVMADLAIGYFLCVHTL